MVNWMPQPGYTIEPRYLAKHESESFCDGVYWVRLTLKWVDFESSRLQSVVWVGIVQLCEAPNRAKTDLLTEGKRSASRWALDLNSSLRLQPVGFLIRFWTQ